MRRFAFALAFAVVSPLAAADIIIAQKDASTPTESVPPYTRMIQTLGTGLVGVIDEVELYLTIGPQRHGVYDDVTVSIVAYTDATYSTYSSHIYAQCNSTLRIPADTAKTLHTFRSWYHNDSTPCSTEFNPSLYYAMWVDKRGATFGAVDRIWGSTTNVLGLQCFDCGGLANFYVVLRSVLRSICSLTCSANAPVEATVGEELAFSTTVSATGCAGDPVFAWAFGDGTSSSAASPRKAYASPGQYNWTSTVTQGGQSCTKSGALSVAPAPLPPEANFTWSPRSPKPGESVQFTDTSTGSPASWSWNFGDGSASVSPNPKHTFANAGTFSVTLTATNDSGSGSVRKDLVIAPSVLPIAVSIIDPEEDWPKGRFPRSAASLEGGGKVSRGAAADGLTQLLIRVETSVNAEVTVAFATANAGFVAGRLYGLTSSTAANSVTVSPELVRDKYVGYAVFEVPSRFPSASGSESTVHLRVHAEVEGAAGEETASVILIRPPLILLHGLRSSGETWSVAPFLSRYQVYRPLLGSLRTVFTPSYNARESLLFNRGAVRVRIQSVLDTVHANGFAARRVDVVAHSMGGLLARQWAGAPQYSGNIYRLITLNSPHHGSPWASILAFSAHPLLEYPANLLGGTSEYLPALRELGTKNISLPPARVWTHLIAGTDGSDGAARDACTSTFGSILSKIVLWAQWSTGLLRPDNLFDLLFAGEQHDVLVSRSSQLAGNSPSSSVVTLIDGPDGIHLCNTQSGRYSLRAIQLLNESPNEGSFAESLPAVAGGVSSGAGSGVVTAEADSRLVIATPVSGSLVELGQEIPVTLSVDAGMPVESVAMITDGDLVIDSSPPFQAGLTAPNYRLGRTQIVAVARLNDGTFVVSAPVEVSVTTNVPVTSLAVTPNTDLVLRVGDRERIEFAATIGGANNPVLLASDDVETSYSTQGIAKIVDGYLVAANEGDVVIRFQKDAAISHIRLTVKEPLQSARRRAVRH